MRALRACCLELSPAILKHDALVEGEGDRVVQRFRDVIKRMKRAGVSDLRLRVALAGAIVANLVLHLHAADDFPDDQD
jgi:hypothetical protein